MLIPHPVQGWLGREEPKGEGVLEANTLMPWPPTDFPLGE